MVALADEVLNLLLTSLELLHDLTVSLLGSEVAICFPGAHVSEDFSLNVLVLLKLRHVIVIDALQLLMCFDIFLRSIFFHFVISFNLHGSEVNEILLYPAVFVSQIDHLTIVH